MFISWELIAAGWLALDTIYWISLIVGGGLIAVSTILGSHGDADVDVHADVDADFDADIGVDADAHFDVDANADVHADHFDAGSLATWFSVRFLVYFMAMFGLVGVVLTRMTDLTVPVIGCSALIAGLIVGQLVHQTLRALRKSSGDSTTHTRDYVNRVGRVTIGVTHAAKGEVAVRVGQGERYVPAIAKHADGAFARGDTIAVVAYHGGLAEVVSEQEYQFLTEGKDKADDAKGEL